MGVSLKPGDREMSLYPKKRSSSAKNAIKWHSMQCAYESFNHLHGFTNFQ